MPFKMVPGRDRKLHRLVKSGVSRNLKRGQRLYSAGDPGGEVFLVTSGLLRLTTRQGKGPERTVELAGPMELAGEEGLVPGAHRRTDARAETSTQVVVLEGREVGHTLRTASRTFHVFLQGKEDALTLARIPGMPRSSGGARRRLAAVLLHLAGRFGHKEEGGVRIAVRVTHQVLADLSGSHRSTATTLLNDWIYERVLKGRGRELWILRPETLAALSQGTWSSKAPGGVRHPPSVDPQTP
jgi:CRP/FNR family transcriptional regulator, cyclic AMP receptor protein